MPYEIDNLYKDLKCRISDYIRKGEVDGLDDDEEEMKAIINEIDALERDPWLAMSKNLYSIPKLLISQDHKDYLINIGVDIWTNGDVEIFHFNDNMTFIPIVAPNLERSVAENPKPEEVNSANKS